MKADLNKQASHILQQAGLFRTGGRIAILKVLLRAGRPLTRKQIAGRLGRTGLNKTTIYRALESFAAAGLVHKAFLHNRTWHFELARHCTDSQCHPHFTCKRCGRTCCLTDVTVPMLKGLGKGFKLERQRVQLEGLCPACNPNN